MAEHMEVDDSVTTSQPSAKVLCVFLCDEQNANCVQLSGSFTNWQLHSMFKEGTEWVNKLQISPGRHQFKFVIDGCWKHDESIPTVTDEHGNINNIVDISDQNSSVRFGRNITYANIILFVGKTGKGKSRIVEILCDRSDLASIKRTKSYTTHISIYPSVGSDPTFHIVDTPGFGDSEGRDGIFIRELITNLKKMTLGIVLVVYVKSALDRLDNEEKKNISILNDMFEDKLFANFAVMLTNADLEDCEQTLKETTNDHITELKNVPVVAFYGRGENVGSSKMAAFALFKEFAKKETLMTSTLRQVKLDQEKLLELQKKINLELDEKERLKAQLELERTKVSMERQTQTNMTNATNSYVDIKEAKFKGFTHLGKAIDRGINWLGDNIKNMNEWLWNLKKKS